MTAATLRVFDRCHALALAAMAEADGLLAAGDQRPAAGAAPAAAPASGPLAAPAVPAAGLTPRERSLLAAASPALLAAIERTLVHLGPDGPPAAKPRRVENARVAGPQRAGVRHSGRSRFPERF